jgi:hypothetical protein
MVAGRTRRLLITSLLLAADGFLVNGYQGKSQPLAGAVESSKAQPGAVSGRELLNGGLRGIKGYAILSTFSGPPELEISATSIRERIKLRLREAKVGVLEQQGDAITWPRLEFEITMVGPTSDGWYAVATNLRVEDAVSSRSHTARDFFIGYIYRDDRVTLMRGASIGNNLRLTMDELLDSFLNAHLEMNPQ